MKKKKGKQSITPPPPPWPKPQAAPALKAALKKAITDWKYRDWCTASSRSAKQAIKYASGASVPKDVEIHFYPREELNYLFLVELPTFNPDEPNPNPDPNDYVLCTWPQYKLAMQTAGKKQAGKKR